MPARLTAADQARLDEWAGHCRATRGELPPGIEVVHRRLVRSVGRGELPDAGPVFVKVMGFPRHRDRLRYLLRALPCQHEARMLRSAAAAGLIVPSVVATDAQRDSLGRPRSSLLVTRALAVIDARIPPRDLAAAVAGLIAARIHAPDLHPGNFLHLADGRVALIDMQSARRSRRPLRRGQRLAMAAKLLVERPDCAPALVEAGVIAAADRARAEAAAAAEGAAAAVRRIRRCLRNSTEFAVHRGLRGTTYARRHRSPAGEWLRGDGGELLRYWIGDRALEVLDGRPPDLVSLFRKWWWLPGGHSVRISKPTGSERRSVAAATLLEGFERYQALVRARKGPPTVERSRG